MSATAVSGLILIRIVVETRYFPDQLLQALQGPFKGRLYVTFFCQAVQNRTKNGLFYIYVDRELCLLGAE